MVPSYYHRQIPLGIDFGKLGFKMRGETSGIKAEESKKAFDAYLEGAPDIIKNRVKAEFGSDFVELKLGLPFATIKALNFAVGWSF
ncbi:MAG: hypothetical protein ACI9XP_000369 [Lentimonas sp.]